LQPEEPKQLRLKLVIAKTLAGQMHKVKGGIETAGRALEHSALARLFGKRAAHGRGR
jgi:hypothetical protein